MGKPFYMTFLHSLFSKKKPVMKAKCPITKENIEEGFGYMLTTPEVLSSKKYWDMVMTEPETLSYTVSHFKNEPTGTHMRTVIFEKYATINKPWMVSDSCINLFEVDKSLAKDRAKQWWKSEGNFTPETVSDLDENTFNQFKEYAIYEAGRNRLPRS
jgi:hypothetical protein